jgi:hypothetical protein
MGKRQAVDAEHEKNSPLQAVTLACRQYNPLCSAISSSNTGSGDSDL